MSIAVELPALGESVLEGTVARWLVKEGDRVELDQPIVEVTTDKVDAEIPAPAAGVIEAIVAAEGDVVPVGGVLARIAEGAAASAAAPKPSPSAKPAAAEAPKPSAAPSAAPTPAPAPAAPAPAAPAPRATPVAKKAAAESGVDLRAVEGTGVGGRVTRADVERGGRPAAAAAPAAAPAPAAREAAPKRAAAPAPAAAPERPAFRADFGHYAIQEGDKVIPMSPLRKLVAEHMVYSKLTSPHVGTVAEIDLGGVSRLRSAHKDRFAETQGVPLTFLPFVVHATVRALREHPALNASVVGDAIVEKKDVHIGIAVETEKGLVVPVVRHADRLSLAGLAAAIEDLSARARTKRLSADDLKGGTFTVTNPGRHGNLYGFAIINQPQVGILRMGEIVKRPVVRTVDGNDAIVIRPIMHLALSYDHRAVDGAPANGFLHRVRELLEEADFDL
jgi:2-oxoglutarate dehydrogenase E2 component (dihydrolipoamide succinyltransferase)